jgi:hypothetical protein
MKRKNSKTFLRRRREKQVAEDSLVNSIVNIRDNDRPFPIIMNFPLGINEKKRR